MYIRTYMTCSRWISTTCCRCSLIHNCIVINGSGDTMLIKHTLESRGFVESIISFLGSHVDVDVVWIIKILIRVQRYELGVPIVVMHRTVPTLWIIVHVCMCGFVHPLVIVDTYEWVRRPTYISTYVHIYISTYIHNATPSEFTVARRLTTNCNDCEDQCVSFYTRSCCHARDRHANMWCDVMSLLIRN